MKVVDLFCGAGGFSEGFRMAGHEVVAGADIDPDACATFALNFPGSEVIVGDLRKAEIRDRVGVAAEAADIIVGGPPCQAFSQVRNHDRLLDDPRNSLYKEFVAVLRQATPLAFAMENVPGLSQMQVQRQVEEDLSIDGMYEVNVQLVDACDFGVPQTRQRIVFLAVRKSLGAGPLILKPSNLSARISLERHREEGGSRYSVRAGVGAEGGLRALADPMDTGVVSVEQAISDLTFLEVGRRDDEVLVVDLPEPSSEYQRVLRSGLTELLTNVSVPRMRDDTALRLSAIPPGGNYLDLEESLKERYLTGQKWGPNNGSGRLGRRHYYAYRRLHPKIWAWTLNTKADSAYHWSSDRALSVREFARLQSFRDAFTFTVDPRKGPIPGRIDGGAAHSKYRQVGNAVPPLLGRAIANELAVALGRAANVRKSA